MKVDGIQKMLFEIKKQNCYDIKLLLNHYFHKIYMYLLYLLKENLHKFV